MRVQTLRSVPFTEVLSRLPDEVDRAALIDCFSQTTHYAYGTNSHSLVPWGVLMDDLTDCCIELGYGALDINGIFPPHILVGGELRSTFHMFVDLEN
jgi:hypothetical protein